MEGDCYNPSLLYPVAAPAPSGFDRMIRLTCHRGRLQTPCKKRVRFLHRCCRPKSTTLAGDNNLLNTVLDILNHLEPMKVATLHRWPRLGDPPLAPEHQIDDLPLAPDNGVRDIILELSNLMKSLSVDSLENSEADLDECSGSHSSDVGHVTEDTDGENFDDLEEYSGYDSSDDGRGTEDVNRENFVIEASEGKRSFELPMRIYNKLHSYQREALQWLWNLHCRDVGGLLCDDMGLGKTVQVCAFLSGLFHSGLIKRALIVCPKTVSTQWVKELEFVGLEEKIRRFLSPKKDVRNSDLEFVFKEGGILLTTYDMVRHNHKLIRGDFYNRVVDDEDDLWNYVVVDEGHMIKDPKTKRAQSLHDIPCIHRIVITGTPMQNSLMEMWALSSFCCPEVLGNMEEFETTYEKIIVQSNNKNATSEEKQAGLAVAKKLMDQISPYFLRRMKGEVQFDADPSKQSSLSHKHELVIWLKLTKFQREIYSAFIKAGQFNLSKQVSVLSAISTLKRICDHPGSLDMSKYTDEMSNNSESRMFLQKISELKNMTDSALAIGKTVSCKLLFIMSLLEILLKDNHKILIFSETLHILDCIEEALNLKGYKFLRIDGKTEISDRKRLVEEFQAGSGAPIFLLSTKVGGLGVTLTEASRVILVNPSWNPSTDSQSVDRAYRYGQTKDVIVYRLMTSGTIEEKIYKLQVFKGALFQTTTGKKRTKAYFDREEAKEILSLPKQGFDVSLTQKQLEKEHHGQPIDASLETHIKILLQQGIAGVSQHSLLFRESDILPTMG